MIVDDYIAQAMQVLATNLHHPDASLTAAVFGQLLRQANPQKTWKDFEFSSFKRFLEALEQRGLLELVETDKRALAVKSRTTAQVPAGATPKRANNYNPLRKAVWAAFVFSVPEGQRYMHRRRGDVRMGLRQSPTPIDEWVEVSPVEETTQKAWGREFANGDVTAEKALTHPQWHTEFPKALAAIHPRMRGDWNRLRSERISEHIKQWAIHNGVSHEILFEQDDAAAYNKPNLESVDSSSPDDPNRQAILAAITTLPTSDLMRLWLPVGVVLDAVRAQSKRQDT